MVNMKKYSFIIIFHNEEARLGDMLKSVFRLTYPKKDMEIICVDDASTDNSAIIAKSFPAQYVRLDRCGISKARNIGFKKSTGKYILFLDAHLVLKNRNTLKILDQYFNKYSHVAAICGEYKSVHRQDWNFVRDLRRIVIFNKNEEDRFITLNNFTTLSLAICAFRRSALIKYEFPDGFINSYGEDTFLQLQMHKDNHTFLYTPRIVGLHDANISRFRILQKMLYEIRASGNIILRTDNTISVPYLHYFLSYPLLVIITMLLSLINHAFMTLFIVALAVECIGALKIFFVTEYSVSKRLITFFYVIGKELIQGIYLPFYILIHVRSFQQFRHAVQVTTLWELKKYSLDNILTRVSR